MEVHNDPVPLFSRYWIHDLFCHFNDCNEFRLGRSVVTLEDCERKKKVNRVENNIKFWRRREYSGEVVQIKGITNETWQNADDYSDACYVAIALNPDYESRLKPKTELVPVDISELPRYFVCRNSADYKEKWTGSRDSGHDSMRKNSEYYCAIGKEWKPLWIEREV